MIFEYRKYIITSDLYDNRIILNFGSISLIKPIFKKFAGSLSVIFSDFFSE